MKAYIFARILASVVLFMATPLLATTDIKPAGTYELQGIMEMAGSLTLKADHTYEARFSYGAADWAEHGRWKQKDAEIVLSRARFLFQNTPQIPLLLPSGTRFIASEGHLVLNDPARPLLFIDPSRTPSPQGTKDQAGEGRMRVRGEVLHIDEQKLVVKADECLVFDVTRLTPDALKKVQGKRGKRIDVEIPFSAIISGGSCP